MCVPCVRMCVCVCTCQAVECIVGQWLPPHHQQGRQGTVGSVPWQPQDYSLLFWPFNIASGCFNLVDFVNCAPALLSVKAVWLHCTRNSLVTQHKSVCRPQLVRIAEHSDSLLSCPRECTAVPPDSSPCILP